MALKFGVRVSPAEAAESWAMDSRDDDFLFLEEDQSPDAETPEVPGWRILIVDDDEGVHLSTRLAFRQFRFAGQPVHFESAYSGAQARLRLSRDEPYACILLDVVMETDHAGLDTVRYIRRDLGQQLPRIILRTGQPGNAPEISVVQDYDINDYREKSRTTIDHLRTSVTAALRSYEQIVAVQQSRTGLETVIKASAALLSQQNLPDFAAGIVTQVAALLHAAADGMVCLANGGALQVLASAGRYAHQVGRTLDTETDRDLVNLMRDVLRERASRFGVTESYLYLPVTKLGEIVVVVHTERPIADLERKLLEIFGINIAIGFDNSFMYREIERLAFVDPLTGLPNLHGLERRIGELQGSAPRVLAFADIDHFEVINDGLGRAVGDLVLRNVATSLIEMKGLELLARIGGDVFGCVFATSADGPGAMLMGIGQRLKQTMEIDGHVLTVSATVGAVQFHQGQLPPAVLVANAGVALKEAKRTRQGGHVLFEESMNAELRLRLHLTSRMDEGLRRRDFFLLYQPQIDLVSGKLVGVEALVRWRDGGDIVPPNSFIPVAESSGLILPLGRWVLEEAVRQQREWAANGLVLRMAVNVSSRQLREDEGLVEFIAELLKPGPLPLEIEVTESGVVGDHEGGMGRLRAIQALGVQIAIDDFGTGYSSLGQLRHLPADRLKIDRVFVDGIERDPDDRQIAEMVVGMGRRLRLSVLAEGVEREGQRDLLRTMGCDEAQGYLFARPLPPADLPPLALKIGVSVSSSSSA